MKKRRKLKIERVIFIILVVYLLIYLSTYLMQVSIQNVFVFGQHRFFDNDQTIMEMANLDDYPSCILTSSRKIVKKLERDPRIKSAKVERRWFCQLHLYIEEYPILFIKRSDYKAVLDTNKEIALGKQLITAPVLINHVPSEQYPKLIKAMKKINQDVLDKISEIEYSPNNVDKERFLLSMNDGNYVYLTLTKYDKLNYYLLVLEELEGRHGVFYWDAGNYFKIID